MKIHQGWVQDRCGFSPCPKSTLIKSYLCYLWSLVGPSFVAIFRHRAYAINMFIICLSSGLRRVCIHGDIERYEKLFFTRALSLLAPLRALSFRFRPAGEGACARASSSPPLIMINRSMTEKRRRRRRWRRYASLCVSLLSKDGYPGLCRSLPLQCA